MKREVIADKAIWRGAKMYIMNIWDKEGVRFKEPELLLHGIEAVRSSTPMVCRDNIKKCLKIIMNQTESDLQGFIKTFNAEFKSLPFEQVAFPRSVNGLEEYSDSLTICRKATPIHVRGALVYNHMIEQMGLDHKYSMIRNKDKIRFAYLRSPNPARSHVIAAPDELPGELNLKEYIDYDTQWEKTFKAPIKSITDLIGWKLVKSPELKFE